MVCALSNQDDGQRWRGLDLVISRRQAERRRLRTTLMDIRKVARDSLGRRVHPVEVLLLQLHTAGQHGLWVPIVVQPVSPASGLGRSPLRPWHGAARRCPSGSHSAFDRPVSGLPDQVELAFDGTHFYPLLVEPGAALLPCSPAAAVHNLPLSPADSGVGSPDPAFVWADECTSDAPPIGSSPGDPAFRLVKGSNALVQLVRTGGEFGGLSYGGRCNVVDSVTSQVLSGYLELLADGSGEGSAAYVSTLHRLEPSCTPRRAKAKMYRLEDVVSSCTIGCADCNVQLCIQAKAEALLAGFSAEVRAPPPTLRPRAAGAVVIGPWAGLTVVPSVGDMILVVCDDVPLDSDDIDGVSGDDEDAGDDSDDGTRRHIAAGSVDGVDAGFGVVTVRIPSLDSDDYVFQLEYPQPGTVALMVPVDQGQGPVVGSLVLTQCCRIPGGNTGADQYMAGVVLATTIGTGGRVRSFDPAHRPFSGPAPAVDDGSPAATVNVDTTQIPWLYAPDQHAGEFLQGVENEYDELGGPGRDPAGWLGDDDDGNHVEPAAKPNHRADATRLGYTVRAILHAMLTRSCNGGVPLAVAIQALDVMRSAVAVALASKGEAERLHASRTKSAKELLDDVGTGLQLFRLAMDDRLDVGLGGRTEQGDTPKVDLRAVLTLADKFPAVLDLARALSRYRTEFASGVRYNRMNHSVVDAAKPAHVTGAKRKGRGEPDPTGPQRAAPSIRYSRYTRKDGTRSRLRYKTQEELAEAWDTRTARVLLNLYAAGSTVGGKGGSSVLADCCSAVAYMSNASPLVRKLGCAFGLGMTRRRGIMLLQRRKKEIEAVMAVTHADSLAALRCGATSVPTYGTMIDNVNKAVTSTGSSAGSSATSCSVDATMVAELRWPGDEQQLYDLDSTSAGFICVEERCLELFGQTFSSLSPGTHTSSRLPVSRCDPGELAGRSRVIPESAVATTTLDSDGRHPSSGQPMYILRLDPADHVGGRFRSNFLDSDDAGYREANPYVGTLRFARVQTAVDVMQACPERVDVSDRILCRGADQTLHDRVLSLRDRVLRSSLAAVGRSCLRPPESWFEPLSSAPVASSRSAHEALFPEGYNDAGERVGSCVRGTKLFNCNEASTYGYARVAGESRVDTPDEVPVIPAVPARPMPTPQQAGSAATLVVCEGEFKDACSASDLLVLCVAASWCDACRAVVPSFLAAANVTAPLGLQCALVVVDAENPDWVKVRVGVTEVPSFVVYTKGKETSRFTVRGPGDLRRHLGDLAGVDLPASPVEAVEPRPESNDAGRPLHVQDMLTTFMHRGLQKNVLRSDGAGNTPESRRAKACVYNLGTDYCSGGMHQQATAENAVFNGVLGASALEVEGISLMRTHINLAKVGQNWSGMAALSRLVVNGYLHTQMGRYHRSPSFPQPVANWSGFLDVVVVSGGGGGSTPGIAMTRTVVAARHHLGQVTKAGRALLLTATSQTLNETFRDAVCVSWNWLTATTGPLGRRRMKSGFVTDAAVATLAAALRGTETGGGAVVLRLRRIIDTHEPSRADAAAYAVYVEELKRAADVRAEARNEAYLAGFVAFMDRRAAESDAVHPQGGDGSPGQKHVPPGDDFSRRWHQIRNRWWQVEASRAATRATNRDDMEAVELANAVMFRLSKHKNYAIGTIINIARAVLRSQRRAAFVAAVFSSPWNTGSSPVLLDWFQEYVVHLLKAPLSADMKAGHMFAAMETMLPNVDLTSKLRDTVDLLGGGTDARGGQRGEASKLGDVLAHARLLARAGSCQPDPRHGGHTVDRLRAAASAVPVVFNGGPAAQAALSLSELSSRDGLLGGPASTHQWAAGPVFENPQPPGGAYSVIGLETKAAKGDDWTHHAPVRPAGSPDGFVRVYVPPGGFGDEDGAPLPVRRLQIRAAPLGPGRRVNWNGSAKVSSNLNHDHIIVETSALPWMVGSHVIGIEVAGAASPFRPPPFGGAQGDGTAIMGALVAARASSEASVVTVRVPVLVGRNSSRNLREAFVGVPAKVTELVVLCAADRQPVLQCDAKQAAMDRAPGRSQMGQSADRSQPMSSIGAATGPVRELLFDVAVNSGKDAEAFTGLEGIIDGGGGTAGNKKGAVSVFTSVSAADGRASLGPVLRVAGSNRHVTSQTQKHQRWLLREQPANRALRDWTIDYTKAWLGPGAEFMYPPPPPAPSTPGTPRRQRRARARDDAAAAPRMCPTAASIAAHTALVSALQDAVDLANRRFVVAAEDTARATSNLGYGTGMTATEQTVRISTAARRATAQTQAGADLHTAVQQLDDALREGPDMTGAAQAVGNDPAGTGEPESDSGSGMDTGSDRDVDVDSHEKAKSSGDSSPESEGDSSSESESDEYLLNPFKFSLSLAEYTAALGAGSPG